ncbi:MAG: circularly permuted type 2 ATP-grasp protein [Pseudomonadota bacterium]
MTEHQHRRDDHVSANSLPADWREHYTPIPGTYDELVDHTGEIRPAWRDLSARWDQLEPDDHAARWRSADRYMRETGVAHRVYGADHSVERPWPLSHLPLVIGHEEWQRLEAGLIQRADLLEAVVQDVYGPQALIRSGELPARLVAGSPGFLRPLVGLPPRSGHHLHFIAIEIGRGPDGRWWVLGDRTQAPSGAGYALENRIASQRSVGSDLRALRVHRIAGFFQAFRDSLNRMRDPGSTRIGLLTPGPFNETYYEQALLARYLGFLLLEGGDLIHEGDAIYVRTVRGLRRVDVLWRRLDASFCDPVELLPESRLGVAGLVQALRARTVTCVNSLGAGLLESRGLLAFMPRLSMHLLGEPLALPNIATWWLGDGTMREEARISGVDTARLSAFGSELPMDKMTNPCVETSASHSDAQVEQEVVRLSAMPTLDRDGDGEAFRLRPRPFSLRVFLSRTQEGWKVLPGGFCRVTDTDDTRALSMHTGSRSADVWVRSDGYVRPTSLLSRSANEEVRRVPGTLPARAADNLFWLGRYAERAQLSLRLARSLIMRRGEAEGLDDTALSAVTAQLKTWGFEETDDELTLVDALMVNLQLAHGSASAIRDRFSPDAWQSLNRFVIARDGNQFMARDALSEINEALMMLAAFAGLIGENMVRLSGWRFLEIGRRLERAIGTAQVCQTLAFSDHLKTTEEAGDDGTAQLELLLDLADSVMSYRQRYAVTTDRTTALDLIVLDPNNPRSIAFQLEKINDHIHEISDHRAFEQSSDLQRLSFSLWSKAHTLRAADLNSSTVIDVTNGLYRVSEALTSAFIRPIAPSALLQEQRG